MGNEEYLQFNVGPWRIRPRLTRMERSGRTVHLEPRVMRLLVCLHHARGEVLTRDQLFECVWDGRFVSENSLTNAVSELRQALGDQASEIETIPKVGYRLRLGLFLGFPLGRLDPARLG